MGLPSLTKRGLSEARDGGVGPCYARFSCYSRVEWGELIILHHMDFEQPDGHGEELPSERIL